MANQKKPTELYVYAPKGKNELPKQMVSALEILANTLNFRIKYIQQINQPNILSEGDMKQPYFITDMGSFWNYINSSIRSRLPREPDYDSNLYSEDD